MMPSPPLAIRLGRSCFSKFYLGLLAALILTGGTLVQAAPTIVFPPQNQLVEAGSNVVFSVFAAPSSSLALPTITSGALQLWLKAEAGVVTNSSGQISQWQDQSGNGNNGSQSATLNQPLLVNPSGIGGQSAVRFNGNQDGIHGTYLQGTGDVGLSNAMTAFVVYNAFNTTNPYSSVWFVGVPGNFGAGRGYTIYNQNIDFTAWGYDFVTPEVLPTNTYRICTDRVNSSLSSVDVFDYSASGGTNFTQSMSGASTPSPGYYVGGTDPSYGWGGYTLNGDVAELVIYNGYLTEADRLAVLGYLQQKYYFVATTNGFSFQWQFDGTNIAGATNTTLEVADVQTNDAGSYSVSITDLSNSTVVSNAVLSVWVPPSVTISPASQHVVQGGATTFSATPGGTGPFGFQWAFNGVALSQQTNSVLSLTNAQSTNAGNYAVTVTSPYGTAASSNALLLVDLLPQIANQPQSKIALIGDTVSLSVSAAPSVASGTLQLWLKADAGVVTNATGQVTAWQDQSGNSNDATQTNPNRLPALVYPSGIGGAAALRFNGVRDGINGTFLHGIGNVGLSNAMTAFVVYNAFNTAEQYSSVWFVGVPGNAGAGRGYTIYNQNIDFTAWGYDFVTPEVLPTNTYRICTDRVNSSLSSVDVFDYSASGGTNFTQSMSGASTPSSGYYVGGTDPSYGWGGFTLDGDVAELALYKGYLTEADRLTVQNYLQQKYFQIGGSFLDTYQWQFDGTNIAGATNAVLTLTNVQGANGGQYTVIVTDDAGSITSSNAVLLVGSAPAISIEPQSQEVSAGTNVTFSVGATGTAPLNYQWTLDGTTLAQATNSTLTLTNLSQVNSGTYAVTITSPFGVAASSNAFLTVDVLPVFGTQPQGQSVVVGSNATFSVAVRPTSIPPVTSGELQLWLKADAGVITNASGQVSQWEDQSGNTNDAVQSTTNYQPSLVFPPALGGNAAVRFNGNANNINYLHGSGNVGVSSAMTSFTVIDAFSVTNYVPMAWLIGVPSIWGSDRSETAYGGSRDFTTWGYGYIAPFVVPTNTYRIWSDRVNTNLTTLELFDTTAAGSTNFAGAMPPTSPVGAGYYVGGLNPALSQVAGWKLNGDISEFIVYKGQLTDGDRLAVLNYLQEKYFEGGVTVGDTFQWQFDGTNIAGATNATLTITNVQGTDAGTYTVVVTDPAGSVTSSNAVLTALFPAAITTSPISQAVSAGTTVTFTGVASGTAPLSYQWQFGGTNITDATNTTLIVTNAVVANAGNYTLVASNPYGSSTSTPATLSVDESTIQVVSTSASAASTVVVSINFIALGTESGVGFTLNFDPAVMTYVDTAVGSGASGSAMQVNTNQIGSGHLGLGAAEFSGTFPAGTNDVFDITFHTSVVTNTTTTSLTFGNSAANEEISGPTANSLPGVYLPGVIVVSSTSLEGDVSPRPNGDEVMNISDWIQEGRFVAGLDTITNASEFQRADCAPRSTLGDGELTVADWVQVGRYAVGLDQLTALGGPIAPAPSTRQSGHPGKESDSPALTLVPLSQGAQMNSVSVQLASQGEVNSAGFSVTYNPALVQFINATLASGATGAAFIQNTNSARPGVLGFVVGSLAPATFPAGTAPLVTLNFAPVAFSNTTALAFANLPVACQLADANAQPLSANFVNASLAVGGGLWPTLAITPNGNDISLSWPSSGASFTLQAASSLSGAWSNVVVTPTTNGNTVTLTAPVTGDSVYYRLKY